MWLRWAILIGLGYILWRLIRPRRTLEDKSAPTYDVPSEDIMVKDPWCNTYLPKGQAIEVRIQGRSLYFCSEQCRDNYLEKGRGVSKEED